MKYLLLILTLSVLSACASTQYALVDVKGHTESQRVMDAKQCSVYHYDNGFKYVDTQYYYACMDQRGYKMMAESPDRVGN